MPKPTDDNPPYMNKLFKVRDEIIDCVDDVNDYLIDATGQDMNKSVLKRLKNALDIINEIRKDLDIPDRNYLPEG